jgi:hypothetical protein
MRQGRLAFLGSRIAVADLRTAQPPTKQADPRYHDPRHRAWRVRAHSRSRGPNLTKGAGVSRAREQKELTLPPWLRCPAGAISLSAWESPTAQRLEMTLGKPRINRAKVERSCHANPRRRTAKVARKGAGRSGVRRLTSESASPNFLPWRHRTRACAIRFLSGMYRSISFGMPVGSPTMIRAPS